MALVVGGGGWLGEETDEELGEEEAEEMEEGEESGGMEDEKHHTAVGLAMRIGDEKWFGFSFSFETGVVHAFNKKRRWHLLQRCEVY